MKPNLYCLAYLVYLPFVVATVFLVSRSLFRNSYLVILDIFRGNEELTRSVNNLFKIGFILLNLGYGCYIMTISQKLASPVATVEALSVKIGSFSIYLGVMLFLHLFFFLKGRKAARSHKPNPPQAPAITN